MKTNIYFQQFTIIMVCTFMFPMHGMNRQRADNLITSINNKINQLKTAQTKTSDIHEINSPEIQKEHQQLLTTIIHDAQQLDNFIKTVPSTEQATWINKQTQILESAKNVFKNAITTNISTTWQQQGKAIAQAAVDSILAGVSAAAVGLVSQGMQMGTGNLLALDSNTLLITGLTATVSAALAALTASRSSLLLHATPTAFNESLITPSITNYTYTIKMPSLSGPITNWITTEAIIIANKMIEDRGGIGKMLGSINLAQTLLPTPNKQLGRPSNELVAAALPTVQSVIGNQKIATVLTEIGWIVAQSATVGATLYLAGFGYTDSITQSMGNAVLTGLAQGTLATLATFGRIVSPGAIINITLAPLAQQAFVIAGGTQQGAVTAVIQATVTEVSNVLMNESKKQGGLLQTLQRGKELLGQTISSHWSSTWATIVNVWENIKETEPVPL